MNFQTDKSGMSYTVTLVTLFSESENHERALTIYDGAGKNIVPEAKLNRQIVSL